MCEVTQTAAILWKGNTAGSHYTALFTPYPQCVTKYISLPKSHAKVVRPTLENPVTNFKGVVEELMRRRKTETQAAHWLYHHSQEEIKRGCPKPEDWVFCTQL